MGGYIPFLCICLFRTTCPSVIYPLRSGTGWVMSSSGMVSIGMRVMEPFFPFTCRPSRIWWQGQYTYIPDILFFRVSPLALPISLRASA